MPADRPFGRDPGGRNGSNSPARMRTPKRLHWGMTVTSMAAAVILLSLALAACSGDKAKELLETAQFEERQMNVPHAKQLYEEVIRLYPSSREAQTARERLAKLNAG
jgi:hypothetical protein